MKALPPPPWELIDEPDAGGLPPGVPLVLILILSLTFWGIVAALVLHR